jgi:hexosaminidase
MKCESISAMGSIRWQVGACGLLAAVFSFAGFGAVPATSGQPLANSGGLGAGDSAAATNAPFIIPAPVSLQRRTGVFELTHARLMPAGPGAEKEASRLAADLRQTTGLDIPVRSSPAEGPAIRVELDRALEGRLGEEGYLLSVRTNGVTLRAAAAAGLFYAGITFRQLLPPSLPGPDPSPDTASRLPSRPGGWAVPCVDIEDFPRFPWRGLLLDPARHFLPPEDIKRFIDAMALHKFNSLQLHLTDDQGWRLEIRKYPRLTQVGSLRKESPQHGNRNQGDGQPYGPFFYTTGQVRDLVAYARDRHVTLVPEIEIPGHFLAALTAYPEFSCRGGPFQVRTRWAIEPDILCPGNDQAVAFAKDILAEVVALFPSRFIHIGGDEAPRDRWRTCPKCQGRIKAEGLKNEAELQTWLNRRLEEFLASQGRRMIGWDEILEGGLTPGAAVMSWRGTAGGLAAAAAGHDVVMSPTTCCYFDYAQARGPQEPESIGGFIPLETVYQFEPVPATLPASKRRHILGAQGNLWGEYLWTRRDVEYFAFPRAAALAEVVWSPAQDRNLADFQRRLGPHLRRLEAVGVGFRKP